MNNITDFSDTATSVVGPLLSMQDTYHIPGQMWRALNFPSVPYIGMAVITVIETLAGIVAFIGVIIMLRNFNRPYPFFAKGKVWVMMGACCAVLVWGVGFMVVAGDWFMAWQAKENPLATQLGAMFYMLPNTLTLIIFLIHREPKNVVVSH